MPAVKPLNDRILVQRHTAKQTSEGGIYIPDNAQEKPTQGTVIAVGDGHRNENGTHTPLSISIGETVLFGKYTGQEINLDDTEYLILREDEIYGIVEETAVTN